MTTEQTPSTAEASHGEAGAPGETPVKDCCADLQGQLDAANGELAKLREDIPATMRELISSTTLKCSTIHSAVIHRRQDYHL